MYNVLIDCHSFQTSRPHVSKSGLNTRASFGSQTSLHSDAGGKGDYDITGEVLVGVYYKGGNLVVHVDRVKGLAAADSNGFSDPYVKTYLLPDKSKHSKRKTVVKRKTLNPIYNDTLKVSVNFLKNHNSQYTFPILPGYSTGYLKVNLMSVPCG